MGWESWDEHSFVVCGFVQRLCVSFSESPSLLCSLLVWFFFFFSSLCSLMSPSCCFCVWILNEHYLLGLTEVPGLRDDDFIDSSQNWFLDETLELHVGNDKTYSLCRSICRNGSLVSCKNWSSSSANLLTSVWFLDFLSFSSHNHFLIQTLQEASNKKKKKQRKVI